MPNPASFMVGDDMIVRGELCCLAGWGGVGKSMCANTLAYAGARGRGEWMAGVVKLLEEDHELTLPVMFSQVDPSRN